MRIAPSHLQRFNRSYDDDGNRLISATNGITNAQFYYDGKNRQIARNINGAIRFSSWDNWELLEEWSVLGSRDIDGKAGRPSEQGRMSQYAGGMQRMEGYLQGATGVIKSWDPIYGQLYYYQDKLGSTTHVANANGALLESYHYDLYGTPAETSTHGVVDLYAGERWIPELGLYDLRNRFMSPELGRFLQPDPIGFKGDASNLYRYCGNDSIDKSDPMGLENPPAIIHAGSFWALEKFFDRSNNLQAGLNDWMQAIRPQAGMDGASGNANDNDKFFGAVNRFGASRGEQVKAREAGKNIVDDAHKAASEEANHLRLGHRQDSGDERAYARYVESGKLVHRGHQPSIGHNTFAGPEANLPGYVKGGPCALHWFS